MPVLRARARRRTARARSTRRGWSRATTGIDLAVHRTLAHGGDVRALARERQELGPVEGIAALLRY